MSFSSPLSEQQTRHVVLKLSLTPQESKIVSCLVRPSLDKEIAMELQVSVATIRSHLTHMFKKTGMSGRTELIIRVLEIAREIPQPPVSQPKQGDS